MQMQPFSGGVSKSERALVAGTDGSVAEVEERITQAVKTFGLAPGARKMMDAEKAAAEEAVATGLYGVWRNERSGQDFCGRIGPMSRCFCGHDYGEHVWDKGRKKLRPACGSCACNGFRYIPRRPEEVGEHWLPRRRGFDIRLWQAKCKCLHGHEDHDPNRLSCRAGCSCPTFQSAWLCTCCEGKWEDHESLWETEAERRSQGFPVGQAFFPLASTPQIQDLAFNEQALAAGGQQRSFSLPHRPKPERSVRLMQECCPNYGGASGSGARAGGFGGGLEDAFPPARGGGGFGGGLEDAFPPMGASARGGSAPRLDFRGSGGLEDAFPAARQPGRWTPETSSAASSARRRPESPANGQEDAFPPRRGPPSSGGVGARRPASGNGVPPPPASGAVPRRAPPPRGGGPLR